MYQDSELILETVLSHGKPLSVHDLRLLLRSKRMQTDIAEVALYLLRQGYLEIEPEYALFHSEDVASGVSEDTPLQISIDGKAALQQAQKELKAHRFNEIRAWLTLALAVIANIIAVIALL